ncbi:MAG: hypothetical protein NWF07_13055 [Candidatus Bathyarchaeota archaeon]|nr:hypothetical protein [Candidatus Bathyarchaeota archaeon]
MQSKYQKTYTTYAGSDIVATFNGRVIGELQAITYSVTREKAPVYTMGAPDPRSFSRGKRGIAGSLVFTVFDKDCFYNLKEGNVDAMYWTAAANQPEYQNLSMNGSSTEEGWNDIQQEAMDNAIDGDEFVQLEATYADQIPPFDITISFKNEYGQAATMSILGVEILNEGSGMSIDDITTEKACTFVARGLTHLSPVNK